MDEIETRFAREIAALAHLTVPRSFLKQWLIEQERRAIYQRVPDWRYPLPRPQHYEPFSKRSRRFSVLPADGPMRR